MLVGFTIVNGSHTYTYRPVFMLTLILLQILVLPDVDVNFPPFQVVDFSIDPEARFLGIFPKLVFKDKGNYEGIAAA